MCLCTYVLCTFMSICTCAYICTCICLCAHTYIYTHIHRCVCKEISILVYIHVHRLFRSSYDVSPVCPRFPPAPFSSVPQTEPLF